MARETTKQVKMYKYRITGYYYVGEEHKRFEEELWAEDNIKAMEQVIGKYAWKEALNYFSGRTFMLDVIHYNCL